MALIKLDHITKTYDLGLSKVHALRDIDFGIEKGEFVAIVGQSGSGKSTLMNILGCLDVPTSGSYLLGGRDVSTLADDELADVRNLEIGFVFQSFQLLPRGERAGERRAAAHLSRHRAEGAKSPGAARRCSGSPSAIARITSLRSFRAVSGSAWRSRARSSTDPSLLLADEPTGNLDSATGEDIIRLFLELHSAGNTIVLVTHEPKLAARCPRAVRVVDGLVVADGPGKQVAFENQQDLERAAAAEMRAREQDRLTGNA